MDENLAVNSIVGVVYLLIIVVFIIGFWKMYAKAGKPGWASIIPLYNIYVLLKIVSRPGWWMVLFLVPLVNIVITLIIALDLAKSFRRSTVFGIVLLWLFAPIGYMILGFGKALYTDPTVQPAPSVTPST